MIWYFPSWNGDHRLVHVHDARGEAPGCALEVTNPTPDETKRLKEFLKLARSEGWWTGRSLKRAINEGCVFLDATLEDAGAKLSEIFRPDPKSRITAYRYANGDVTVERSGVPALKKTATTAATMTRGYGGCPTPVPVNERASEVLLAFLTDEQLASWEDKRRFVALGSVTGGSYIVAHRGSEFARWNNYAVYSCAAKKPTCWHDWTVPPEEEALAAKLLIEHDEEWIAPRHFHLGISRAENHPAWLDRGKASYNGGLL